MMSDEKLGAIAQILEALLVQPRSGNLYLGGLAISHTLGAGTHVLRVAHPKRWATEDEVDRIVLALQRATGGIPEPGRHQKVEHETLDHVWLLIWPVAEQPKLF